MGTGTLGGAAGPELARGGGVGRFATDTRGVAASFWGSLPWPGKGGHLQGLVENRGPEDRGRAGPCALKSPGVCLGRSVNARTWALVTRGRLSVARSCFS